MTREENDLLLRQAKDGDEDALNRLIEGNMGLCRSIALRFRDRGAEYDDLVQLASIGMLKAVRSFDFSYGTAFSTYAVPLIIGEIRRFLRDDGAVKIGRGVKKLSADAMRKREEFVKEYGREPKTGELAELCGVETGELVFALGAANPVRSLSDPVGDDDGVSVGELISDPDDGIGRLTDRIALSEAVKGLPPLQRKLIYLRYCREMSQSEAGRVLGMTQVRVSREDAARRLLGQRVGVVVQVEQVGCRLLGQGVGVRREVLLEEVRRRLRREVGLLALHKQQVVGLVRQLRHTHHSVQNRFSGQVTRIAVRGALISPNPSGQLDQQVRAALGGDLVDGVADEGVLRSHAQPGVTFIRSTAEGRALGSLVRQRETKWTKSEDQWEECSVGGSAMTMLFTNYA